MSPIVQTTKQAFDGEKIGKGDLCYAKHRSWDEGKVGIITAATEDCLTVLFHPGIGNVANHFFIPVEEVADEQWVIRWSKDLSEVWSFPEEEESDES